MISKEIVAAVAALIHPHVEVLRVTRTAKLYIDGKAAKAATIYKDLYELLPIEARLELRKLPDEINFSSDMRFGTALIKALITLLNGEGEPDADFSQVQFNDSIKCMMSELKLIVNTHNRKRSALYDPDADRFYQWDYDFILDSLRLKFGDKAKAQWLRSNSEECQFVYCPFEPRIFTDKKDGHKVFNTWSPTTWATKYIQPLPEISQCPMPMEIQKFIDALVPGEDDKKSMLAWMRDCTFGRANPILVLCGTPGVGKNIFILICRALVGAKNYREASRGFTDTKFHNNITNCRLFFLDEMDLKPATRDIMKAYHNGMATVERKHENVGEAEIVHASFCIANNFKENIKLEFTDRKFFAPLLSGTPLLEKMPQEEVDHLVKVLLEDDSYLTRLAQHLEVNYKHNQSERFKKGPFFKELCINSYPYFFKRFINACKEMESFTQKTLNAATKHRVEPGEIVKHLEHYETTFRKPLADFELHVNGTWTATSKIFNKPKQSMNGKDHSPMVDELSALSDVRMPQ